MRLLCYIMETDYTEALTPICISLTNLAENQIHGKDTEAGIAGKSKHGGWHPWVNLWEQAGGMAPGHPGHRVLINQVSPSPGSI